MKIVFGVSNILAVLLLMMACGNVQENKKDLTKAKIEIIRNESIIFHGDSKTLASIKIDGMTCQKMCAGLIKNKLSALKGVIACDIDFESKIATIEYDDSKLSENKMIEIITSLNDGQYSVSKIEIEKTILKERSDENEENVTKETAYIDDDASISFFNIFDVVSRYY